MFDTTPEAKVAGGSLDEIGQQEQLPFPFNQRAFCRYEPIEKKIDFARVLVVNDLLRYEDDVSDLARSEWNGTLETRLKLERKISGMACENISKNLWRLIKKPKLMQVHLSEVAQAVKAYRPDAIVMSGTLTDFDYYNQNYIAKFKEFIHETRTPVLAICGAHQLVGMSFGMNLTTLDHLDPAQKRTNRVNEYQYRFVRIVDAEDPIYSGIQDEQSGIWQDYTKEARVLRVWQNHGLQVEGVPEEFKLLATSYLCKNQAMVKLSEGQMIYAVQFHLEK
ncbi:MAG: gamma-glutamyl-gamma-aminobutyrate hydrolase family protein, partial [Pyrinomonadaceae bacterium]|nr:gamma-glutamyl-gamma-aminobutyrate hydrolase family protein [Pyrinomonadaceae bacterium]